MPKAIKKESGDQGHTSKRAVVDIGSNSVRLVIYEGPARAPISICNEKALCGLGRDMDRGGRLNEIAAQDALQTLGRFAKILEAHGNPPTHVIATAAVREAKDRDAFVEAVNALGFDVRLISGVEEARLAALGVVACEPGASGLVGDMGGGSLELVSLNNGETEALGSLSLGPLKLMSIAGDDLARASKEVDRALSELDWLQASSFKTLYTVGGAWRAVAKIHMRLRSYPLSVLHHYEMTREDVLEICHLISRQSKRSLETIPGIPRRRLDTLPYASLVLQSLIEKTSLERIVISSGGVREGLLYQDLPAEEREKDPFLLAAEFYAQKLSPAPSFGFAANEVIDTLFANDDESERRVRVAACLMADVAAYFHPDHRAFQAFETALRAPLMGVTHEERVTLALTLFRRHDGRSENTPNEQAVGLLPWQLQDRAMRLGLAIRFVATLAPKEGRSLEGCKLMLEGSRLILKGPKGRRAMIGENAAQTVCVIGERL